MRKSNLIKIVSILLISLMVMLFTTTVNAAEEVDLYNELTLDNSNTANTNTNTGNANTNTANTVTNDTQQVTENMPSTGVENYIYIFIAIAVIGVVFAAFKYVSLKKDLK